MIRLLFISLLAFLMFSPDSFAQKEERSREYSPVTFENLSQTYWWLSMHDVSDDFAVDEYARIHHCDLYESYYEDDFQWQLIREGIKEELSRRRPYFPHRYFIYAPIKLERYDFDKSVYRLDERSQLNNVGAMPIFTDKQFKSYCGRYRSIPEYPDSVQVMFTQSINFTGIPLSQNQANELLQTMKEQGNDERLLFLKLSFRVSGFGEVESYATANKGTLRGTLERIEVYGIEEEDPDLIYEEEVKYN